MSLPAPRSGSSQFLAFDEARQWAETLARSNLIPEALQGKPDDVLLVGLWSQDRHVPFITGVMEAAVIERRVEPSAKLRTGLVQAAGHQIQLRESNAERCVLRGRRRGEDEWVEITVTIDEARRAGLLDVTLEEWYATASGNRCRRWVQGDGEEPGWVAAARNKGSLKVRRRENWHRYPADMLRAWAARILCRVHFADVILGLAEVRSDFEQHDTPAGADLECDEPDDDVADAEVVPEMWRELRARLGALDIEDARALKDWWSTQGIPPIDRDDFTGDHAQRVIDEMRRRGWVEAEQEGEEAP